MNSAEEASSTQQALVGLGTLRGQAALSCSRFGKRGFSHHREDARQKTSIKRGYILGCTFHALKAKGISDDEGSSHDKQLFSGHKTESQVLIYDRKVQISPTLDRPVIEEK